MTSIAVWVGVDSRGPASCYIATDSRITWTRSQSWDFGRKAFASAAFPDLFAYAGDVLFPSMLLSQVVAALDAGVINRAHSSPAERFELLEAMARITHKEYPPSQQTSFSVIHASRSGAGMTSAFEVRKLTFTGGSWTRENLTLPWTTSTIVLAEGSGRAAVMASHDRWMHSNSGGTSRACFSAFVESLRERADASSGGAPQLIGLYRERNAQTFGIITGTSRFLHGLPVQSNDVDPSLEWRNELFERCDGRSRRTIHGAQRHGPRA